MRTNPGGRGGTTTVLGKGRGSGLGARLGTCAGRVMGGTRRLVVAGGRMGRARLGSRTSRRARLSIPERGGGRLGLGARLGKCAGWAIGFTESLVSRVGLVISFVERGGLVSTSFQTLARAHVRLRVQRRRLAFDCVLPLKDGGRTAGGGRRGRSPVAVFMSWFSALAGKVLPSFS